MDRMKEDGEAALCHIFILVNMYAIGIAFGFLVIGWCLVAKDTYKKLRYSYMVILVLVISWGIFGKLTCTGLTEKYMVPHKIA